MVSESWVVVYTDGSAKQVQGCMQAGYEVYYRGNSPHNCPSHLPVAEQQIVSRGELQGVLHALRHRPPGEKLISVMDSEYVSKGIVGWFPEVAPQPVAHSSRGGGASQPVGPKFMGAG